MTLAVAVAISLRDAPPPDPQIAFTAAAPAAGADLEHPPGVSHEERSEDTALAEPALGIALDPSPAVEIGAAWDVTGFVRTVRDDSTAAGAVRLELRRSGPGGEAGGAEVVGRLPVPGAFAFTVPAGDGAYELRARSHGAVSAWIAVTNDRLVRSVDVGCLLLVPDGELEGRVVDENNAPVGEAVVFVGDRPVARTDGRGRFRVDALAAGTVSIRVEHPSFAFPAARELEVVPKRPSPELEFVGSPAHRLTVRVTDPNGVPVIRAGVTLTSDRQGGSRFLYSDRDGLATLSVGGDRPLTLRVTRKGYAFVVCSDVTPGTEVPVTLRADSGILISCRDGRGEVIRPVGVRVERWSDRRQEFQATWRAAPNGRHDGVLAPLTKTGRYRIVAWEGRASGAVERTVDAPLGPYEVRTVEVGLGASTEVPVAVADRTGRPLRAARVIASEGSRAVWAALVDEDGRCQVPRQLMIDASDLDLVVSAPGHVTTRSGGIDPFAEALSFRLDRAGVVSGVVRDDGGAPVPNAQVGVVSEADRSTAVRLHRSDSSGRFRFDDLPAGAQLVAAAETPLRVAALLRADSDVEGGATRVQLEPGGAAECSVKMAAAPGGPIEVFVRENAAPAAGEYFVMAQGPSCSPASDWTTHIRSDGYGIFREAPPPGSTLVLYRGSPHPIASVVFDAERARAAGRIEIDLETADVVGHAHDDGGDQPLAGVLVEALLRVSEAAGGESAWRPVASDVSGADGAFRLARIPVGDARLRFRRDGGEVFERAVSIPARRDLVDTGRTRLATGEAAADESSP